MITVEQAGTPSVFAEPDRDEVEPGQESSAVPAHRSWVVSAYAAVRDAYYLPDNWDRMGGQPATISAVETAQAIIARLSVRSSDIVTVLPSPDGGFVIEWQTAPGPVDAIIDVNPDGSHEISSV